jgi:hypothetical protein
MGSSFAEYRGFGFWSRDRLLQRIAGELADIIDAQSPREDWLSELSLHWKQQASGNFNGWIHLELDDFLTTEERRLQVLAFVQQVTERYPVVHSIHRTGILLIRLIRGELKTNAASPLDYMIDEKSIH